MVLFVQWCCTTASIARPIIVEQQKPAQCDLHKDMDQHTCVAGSVAMGPCRPPMYGRRLQLYHAAQYALSYRSAPA